LGLQSKPEAWAVMSGWFLSLLLGHGNQNQRLELGRTRFLSPMGHGNQRLELVRTWFLSSMGHWNQRLELIVHMSEHRSWRTVRRGQNVCWARCGGSWREEGNCQTVLEGIGCFLPLYYLW
jgi:hypothetical protein